MCRMSLQNVVRCYRESRTGREVEALRVPRWDVESGQIVAIVGHNGSGKSTLLEAMAFLQPPDSGQVLLDGQDPWADNAALAARRRCPMLLQKSVLFDTSVLRNVMYGLRMRGLGRRESQRRAMEVLRTVRLESLAARGPKELSGGEQRRVALARLLVLEPDILLLDEPTAHVDHANEQLIEELIRDLHARMGMTVVLSSHNFRQAATLADRIVTLVGGRLIDGSIDNLFSGTLRTQRDQRVFHGEGGLILHLGPDVVTFEDDQACPDTETHVEISIDSTRLQVLAANDNTPKSDHPITGQVESIRQTQHGCRLRIRLTAGQQIRAEMSMVDHQRLGLLPGAPVVLKLGKGTIRVVRILADDRTAD